ncbi:MAG: hypothetical protein M1816_003527 [Peltula sp. TS41687]|nr:MAG: hypothetical protein M1816_003527 [Peltula sp. TS41687]
MLDALELFRRQYLQLLPPEQTTLPSCSIIKDPAFQDGLYEKIFSTESQKYQPPDRYKLRILKMVISTIEAGFDDPDEDVISDDLMSCFTILLTLPFTPEFISVQQKSYVTYTLPSPLLSGMQMGSITLAESRSLIASSGTTGLRTWDAALHLGAYLASSPGRALVSGKNIVELGAGTGFLSLLCAKHLGTRRMLATDGDSRVVEDMKTSMFLNALEESENLEVATLKWGHNLNIISRPSSKGFNQWQLVLGADITYDTSSMPDLLATLRDLFRIYPEIQAIIASTVRNEETFKVFLDACRTNAFLIHDIPFEVPPLRHQTGFFQPNSTPIRILSIGPPPFREGPFSV